MSAIIEQILAKAAPATRAKKWESSGQSWNNLHSLSVWGALGAEIHNKSARRACIGSFIAPGKLLGGNRFVSLEKKRKLFKSTVAMNRGRPLELTVF